MTALWRDPAVPDVWHEVSPLHGETRCCLPLGDDASIVIAPDGWRPATGAPCAQCTRPVGAKRPRGAPKPRIGRIWYVPTTGAPPVVHRLGTDCATPVCSRRIVARGPTVGGIGAPPPPLPGGSPTPRCPACFPRSGDLAAGLARAHARARGGRR